MTRVVRLIAFCICFCGYAVSHPVLGQDNQENQDGVPEGLSGLAGIDLGPDPGLAANGAELDLWRLIESGAFLKARAIAEPFARAHPESFVAQLALAVVQEDAEGNPARALYYYKRARTLYEQAFSPSPRPNNPWKWHALILRGLADVYATLERYQDRLDIISEYNVLYEPDMLAEQAWPLMKLGRFQEARIAADLGMRSGRPIQTLWALNALCAIEFESGQDRPSYEVCKRAVDFARDRGESANAVDLSNLAEAARSLFRFEEAEAVSLEATKARIAWNGNPWSDLAQLYVREGRFVEAFSALKEANGYRLQRPPQAVNSDLNENRRIVAEFLLLIGRSDEALRITSRAILTPDRRGYNSRDPGQDQALMYLLDRRTHRVEAERTLEHASGKSWPVRVWAYASATWHRVQGWLSGRRAARLLEDKSRLVGILAIGTARSAATPPWMAAEIASLLDESVLEEAVAQARHRDQRSGSEAYYSAFLAEAAFNDSEHAIALKNAQKALATLQPAEKILRARVMMIAAESARDLGRAHESQSFYSMVLEQDPALFRRLELTLPVRIRRGRNATGEGIGDAFARSPRFEVVDSSPWLLDISAAPDRAAVCLYGPSQSVVGCSSTKRHARESHDAFIARAVGESHDELFAPKISLSQSDISSLDGSNRTSKNPLEGLFN